MESIDRPTIASATEASGRRTRDHMRPSSPPGRGPVVSDLPESELASAREWQVVPAFLPPRTRITPPMGLARSKRVIYGDNRGPFQTGVR